MQGLFEELDDLDCNTLDSPHWDEGRADEPEKCSKPGLWNYFYGTKLDLRIDGRSKEPVKKLHDEFPNPLVKLFHSSVIVLFDTEFIPSQVDLECDPTGRYESQT
jgi:hypothetical protein